MLIERRHILRLPALAAAGSLFALRQDAAQDAATKLTFDDFVARIDAMAKTLVAAAERNERSYLHEMSALATRLAAVPETKLGQPFREVMRTGLAHRGANVVVVQWSMAPGLTYPPHDHPNYNGITFGVEGECRIRNYTPQGPMPARDEDTPFAVRVTTEQWMTPGAVVSLMTTTEHNIHSVSTFDKPVRGIDVLTRVDQHLGFSFVDIDEASGTDGGVFKARWKEHLSR